ncbi:tripartite tricarboxylate transporter TctB family protein [Ramlibacter monticola]|uniref:Tripartite tricarboxylate transporter TctB family protein n=1 Tax=Ramlibacter monticola TaxID=1926872 RepID=A0A936Z8L6_9BURK|nr:tripartite tricarboxylate transporter TctB family protein [Ramlibacter monticola]MBL0394956.1 tripartite tricarboxylate transporter TctB family protein [Ramlibacter monticola]
MSDPAVVSGETAAPRSDLKDAVGWIALGAAVLIGSLAMDRLEQQNINPVTVPGLLPGLLGIAMMLLGLILGVRSWRRGAFAHAAPPVTAHRREERRRVALAVALCCGYGIVLVGHGIPFWLASTLYVTASILLFQRISHDLAERRLTPRAWGKALAIGVISSVVTWAVFEKLFLVRLP